MQITEIFHRITGFPDIFQYVFFAFQMEVICLMGTNFNPLFHSRNIFHHPGWTLGTNSNWIRIFKDESVSPKH